MKDFRNKLVLITGANSGIGEALALAFAREGARLVLTARDKAKLEAVQKQCAALGAEARVFSADVADETQMQALADFVHAKGESLDVLINNAGMVMAGLLHEVPQSDWDRFFQVNVFGVVRASRLFIPKMIAAGKGGHIVNVGSAAGIVGQPGMTTYCATKHAVLGISSSLRYELARHRIGVTALCPGYVQTPIESKVHMVGTMNTEKARKKISEIFKAGGLTADRVAQRALKAIRGNEALALIGKDAQQAYWGKRLFPGLLDRMFTRGGR